MANFDEKSVIFYYNGLASLTKAIAFRSMAKHAQQHNERVNSTVSAYYSLLHLAICLIYFCPDKVEKSFCNDLLEKHNSGRVDPSKIISHAKALKFVKDCMKYGLDKDFFKEFKFAKQLREFVNYGPKITIEKGKPTFGPCTVNPADCDRLVPCIDVIFKSSIIWAKNNSQHNNTLVGSALNQCGDFFRNDDLFYKSWCSNFTITEALRFLEELRSVTK